MTLTVLVKDSGGTAIPVAHVIVYQQRFRGSTAVVRPPDQADNTNASGIVRFDLKVPAGEELRLSIEVSAENFAGEKEDIELGTAFPDRVLKQYFLEPKKGVEEKPESTTTIKVHVERKKGGDPVDGARVTVLSLGGFTPKVFNGQTDANGDVSIVTPLNNEFDLKASKDLFGEAKTGIRQKDYLKEIGPVTLKLERQPGAQVSVHVKDDENQHNVVDATVVLEGPNYYSETTDTGGNALFFVAEAGNFTVRISQQYYEAFRDQTSLSGGEQPVRLEFPIKRKPKKKDEGATTIEVTVRQGDRTDRVAGYNLVLPDASVTAGPTTIATDSSGVATISGDFDGSAPVPVTVTADGYKSQTKTVRVAGVGGNKIALTFLMQPTTSEDLIEVTVTGAPLGKQKAGALDGVTVTANGSSATTNPEGHATLKGTFEGAVEVAAEKGAYLRQTKSITVSGGKASLAFNLQVEPTEDSITATVLGGKEDGGSATPVAGAVVSANGLTGTTDNGGHTTITGDFKDSVEVSVEAKGFVSQTQQVSITKPARTGSASFTLKPEPAALQLIVEVRDASDPNHAPVAKARVSVPSADAKETDAKGEASFALKGNAQNPLEKMRGGFAVRVHKDGYTDKSSDIPAQLLEPRKDARRYSIDLTKDWSELIKALAEIEGRIGALRGELRSQTTKTQSVKLLAAKSIAARGRVESWLKEMKAARAALDTKLSGTNCEAAKRLGQTIESLQKESAEKEKAFTKLLEEATGLAANCKTKADGAVVAEKYRHAIKLIGELGTLGPKANDANLKLTRYAEAMKDGGSLQTKLQQTLTSIDNDVRTAEKELNTANSDFNDAYSTNLNLPGKRAALASDYAKLKARFQLTKNYDHLPKDLAARLGRLDQTLDGGAADTSLPSGPPPDLARIDDVIKPNLTQMQQFSSEANGVMSGLKDVLCKVEPMDQVLEEIRTRLTNAGFDLGLAADLPAKAQACGAAASPSPSIPPTPTPSPSPKTSSPSPSPSTPTPSPSTEITVPDVSGFKDVKAMKAAAGPDMVGHIVAVKDKPPDGQKSPFFDQNPKAKTKAHRGDPLTIFVYQAMLQPSTPTPSPTPVRKTNVPDLNGLTLDQAVTRLKPNMRIASDEVGEAPPTPELALTIFYQSPSATEPVDATKPIVITVKRYGSAQSKIVERFDGTYVGRYKGDDSGAVRFTVNGGSISISSPGSGAGQVSASGAANFKGAGRDGSSSYSFSGTFSVGPTGKATANGSWSGTQSGFTGHGTWSAARP